MMSVSLGMNDVTFSLMYIRYVSLGMAADPLSSVSIIVINVRRDDVTLRSIRWSYVDLIQWSPCRPGHYK